MDKLSTFITEYLKICESIKKLDTKTIKAYRIDLLQFHTFMLSQNDFTDKTALNSYISLLHQKYRPKTAKRKIAALKAFFHYLICEEVLAYNPFDRLSVNLQSRKYYHAQSLIR